MPNWTTNEMVVYGSKSEIDDLYQKIENAIANSEKTNHWNTYQIYEEFGHTDGEIMSDSSGYIRGSFITLENIKYDAKTATFYFHLWYESAWSSMYEGWDYLLSHHYKTLKQVTRAEEPGCDVFINTDTNGRFLKERYRMYVEDQDEYYFETEEEFLDRFEKETGASLETFKQCEQLTKMVQGNFNGQYICVNEYSPN